MSLSSPYSALSLYCSEVADDIVGISDPIPSPNLDSLSEDESFMIGLFDSELDQMLGSEQLRLLPEVVGAHQDAVNWMLKVHAYYNFRPETAYLSVAYLDRFLCTRDLPQGKEWALQLLSVACIALAAKMEEESVPLLLELQVMEPRFMFTAITVQQMELLVMAVLKWRLRVVTPFSFLSYFISKSSCLSTYSHNSEHLSDLILSACRVMDYLDFLPSSIAAASVLWVTGKNVGDDGLEHLHKRLNKEMVKRCHYLIKQSMCEMTYFKKQRLEPLPASPDGVLGADISDQSCDVVKCGGGM